MENIITVVCTVKNGEETIERTINSVLEQTYKNIEFIIIDDGSVDNTLTILKEFQKKDERIKIYPTSGLGRSKALNKAIKHSSGEFIANVDADDIFHPQKLEIQFDVISKLPEYFLVSTKSQIIYDDEIPSWQDASTSVETKHTNISSKLLIQNQISHPSVLMRRKHLLELDGYNENRKSQVDYDLWLRAYTYGYKMLIINQELVGKRIHNKQSFENKNRLKYTFNSMSLKLKFIVLNRRLFLAPVAIINFILAQLPFKFRRQLNQLIDSFKTSESTDSIS